MFTPNTQNTLFIAMSHDLTPAQREGWGKVVELRDVNPELAAWCAQIPVDATAGEIKAKAAEVVAEANKAGATHFCLLGEFTLAQHANNFAHRTVDRAIVAVGDSMGYECPNHAPFFRTPEKDSMEVLTTAMVRESKDFPQDDGTIVTRKVLNFAGWRKMF